MIVLIAGATGLIGSRIAAALRAAGHRVIEGRRASRNDTDVVAIDFASDLQVHDLVPKLKGVDAVINVVGILRESGRQTFERIHTRSPKALFDACAAAGVQRIVQISALGADTGTTGYFTSKRAADEHLSKLPLAWTIVQPALVFGPGGTSARMFKMLASLPLVPLPGRGAQGVQPIHVDDLVAAIVQLLTREDFIRKRVQLAGPEPLTLREFLRRLRAALGLGPSRFVPVPIALVRLGAQVGELSRNLLLDRETLAMLQAGNTADPEPTRRVLQREPRPVEAFIPAEQRAALAHEALLSWLLPMLRVSVAAVWIWTGIVSLGLYPREESYELLARTGIGGALASVALFGAAALDLLFGLGTLMLKRRRWLWLAQIAVILVYTLIISVRLPELWLHPFGPISKNLPMLVGIYMLYVLETRWNTSS